MDQEEIKRLLHAASFHDCCAQQRQEILDKFLEAIPVDERRHDKSGERDRAFIKRLYGEIAGTMPSLFPYLFPVFAVLCGERSVKGFAEIDWDFWRNWSKRLGA